MAAPVPRMETIRVSALSVHVWPGLAVLGILAGVLAPPMWSGRSYERLRLVVLLGVALLWLAWYLGTPYLKLGRTYLGVRGALRGAPARWRTFLHAAAPEEEVDDGALIRLADIASFEVRGNAVVLTWWHRGRSEKISLRGLRSRDRQRFIEYLGERIGGSREGR